MAGRQFAYNCALTTEDMARVAIADWPAVPEGSRIALKFTHDQKRVLVTGGAGFLGSHLCDRLIAGGHDVLCVDNFYTGSKANVDGLLGHPRFELMRHDVTFPLYVEVDRIFNLACPASPIHYQQDPVQTTKTSVHGAINMLGLAKRLRAHPAGQHQRGVRRSGNPPAGGRLLGPGQPDRHPQLL